MADRNVDRPLALLGLDLPLVAFESDWRDPPDEICEERLFRRSHVINHRLDSMIIQQPTPSGTR